MQSPERCCEATDSMFTLPGEETVLRWSGLSGSCMGSSPVPSLLKAPTLDVQLLGGWWSRHRKAGGWLLFLNGLLTHSATLVGTLPQEPGQSEQSLGSAL